MILVGMGLGDMFYPGYRRRVDLPDLSGSYFVRSLAFLGQNSLAVYLVHQPVLIALFYLGGVSLPWH